MSLKCDICGKDLQTPQGLRGHKQLAHGSAIWRSMTDDLAEIKSAVKNISTVVHRNRVAMQEQIDRLAWRNALYGTAALLISLGSGIAIGIILPW